MLLKVDKYFRGKTKDLTLSVFLLEKIKGNVSMFRLKQSVRYILAGKRKNKKVIMIIVIRNGCDGAWLDLLMFQPKSG